MIRINLNFPPRIHELILIDLKKQDSEFHKFIRNYAQRF
ncbi:hypothetical protein SAMN06265220_103202 [Flavobacterium nitrogenifigens]|uniref:Uncharacterized protein n=1 Tax=Flavobacterium nitrogenifigens TaxID=1617283 RepID=A0A521DMV0_9FLAO|nr:hypothetical protein SAMN06265220_103202 [Flavobacterium nitrogenifigens]